MLSISGGWCGSARDASRAVRYEVVVRGLLGCRHVADVGLVWHCLHIARLSTDGCV